MTSKNLKPGFTTGAAAAGATKAALLYILNENKIDIIEVRSLNDEKILMDIYKLEKLSENQAECIVIKDAGDDPDVTHKAQIGAKVLLRDLSPEFQGEKKIHIGAGKGVGMVTKPGLEVSPGKPAINSGPEKMILESVNTVLSKFNIQDKKKVDVEVFVPKGEELAQKTLNARLGIIGGISILGTTGIVKPMSHDAYIATIKSGISVAEAMGVDTLVFTTGRRSERFAMKLFPKLPEEAFIQTGDFFEASLQAAQDTNTIKNIIITVFFGKAVKMAMGFPHTHAAKSELTMKNLAEWADTITGNKDLVEKILQSNTARHAFTYIYPKFPELVSHVGQMIIKSASNFSYGKLRIESVIFDFDGKKVF